MSLHIHYFENHTKEFSSHILNMFSVVIVKLDLVSQMMCTTSSKCASASYADESHAQPDLQIVMLSSTATMPF